MAGNWWWCMRHARAETGDDVCPPDDRMGPYESRDAAEHWKDRLEARNDKWDREDKEWTGEEPD